MIEYSEAALHGALAADLRATWEHLQHAIRGMRTFPEVRSWRKRYRRLRGRYARLAILARWDPATVRRDLSS